MDDIHKIERLRALHLGMLLNDYLKRKRFLLKQAAVVEKKGKKYDRVF